MAAFKNNPRIVTILGKRMMEQYTHQPIIFDHFDTHCQILANGRVKLTKPVEGSDEFDEIEIPASLAFKLVTMLKDTRSVEYVEVGEDGKPKAGGQTIKQEAPSV